jgi:hypothetical protein
MVCIDRVCKKGAFNIPISNEVTCNVNNDCSTGSVCIDGVCKSGAFNIPMTPWAWAIIVIGILLIILAFVKFFCWPFDKKKSKTQYGAQNHNYPANNNQVYVGNSPDQPGNDQ